MIREQWSIVNNFGVSSPLPEWSEFLNSNVKAISTYNETIDGATSQAAVKKNFENAVKGLKDAVTSAFKDAPKIENQTLACRARLIPSVQIYVHRLQTRAFGLASGLTVQFIGNATVERQFIKNYYSPFYRNLTICNGKYPNEQRGKCIVTLVSIT